MAEEATRWSNVSPGDASCRFPETLTGNVADAVRIATNAAGKWARLPMEDRAERLSAAANDLKIAAEELATGIAEETGKPITEARGEVTAVVAKVELTIADAMRWLRTEDITDGPHPGAVRMLPRGPAAVIAPFNFPLHLGNGAALAYLIAGNPVIMKPSPMAANVAERYGEILAAALPVGVFQILHGWGQVARMLCVDPAIRSVCFTGSVEAGRVLSTALAAQYDKDLALELGGKNASIVCADADMPAAAKAVAESLCLTTGQRCNATSRVLVEKGAEFEFLDELVRALAVFVPGDPLEASTRMGPLISEAAVERYRAAVSVLPGESVVAGGIVGDVGGKKGNYVNPVVHFVPDAREAAASVHFREEIFAPILIVTVFTNDDDAIRLHDASPYGLSASIFTKSRDRFESLGGQLRVGNLYANLPTTFSPSTLPFGGLRRSGNRHPGGRWFVRFAADEQAVQWKADGFTEDV